MQYTIFPHDFSKYPQNLHNILTIYPNLNTYLCITIHQNKLFSFAFGRAFRDRLLLSVGSILEKKCGKMAVIPCGYGRIGEILHRRIRLDWGLYRV